MALSPRVGVRRHPLLRVVRDQRSAARVNGLADFELGPPEAATLDDLLASTASLYAAELERRELVFVVERPGADVFSAPFYYLGQVQAAEAVFVVGLDDAAELARRLAPPPEVVFLWSGGRCGSTLLSRALAHSHELTSYSEPDVYSQLSDWMDAGVLSVADAVEWIRVCTAVLRPAQRSRAVALKFRGRALGQYEAFLRAHPDAKSIFLYRNAIDVVQSYDRVSRGEYSRRRWAIRLPPLRRLYGAVRLARGTVAATHLARYESIVRGGSPTEVVARYGFLGLNVLKWAFFVEQYLRMRREGYAVHGLRYEDLVAHPAALMTQLLDTIGCRDADVAAVLREFKRDSQEGTSHARDRGASGFTGWDRRLTRDVLARYTSHRSPGVVLPGTLSAAGGD